MKTKRTTKQVINNSLQSWESKPIEVNRLQSQFEEAKELSAIRQWIDLGLYECDGITQSERVQELITYFDNAKS